MALVNLNAKLGWGDGGCLLLVGVLLIGAQALAAFGSGDLLSEHLWSDGFLKDLNTYLPLELVSRSYATLTDRTLGSQPGGWYTAVPFLRDYSNLGIMLLSALHLTLIARQWPRISRIFSHLCENGALVVSRQSFNGLVHKYDPLFNSWIGHAVSAAGALAIVAFILRCFAAHGFYQGLAPSQDGIAWQLEAYGQWWARPSNVLSFGLNAFIYCLVLYILFRHIVIGVVAVFALNEITRKASVHLIINHPDGVGGFRLLRDGINDVFLSVLLSAGLIFLGLLYLPTEGGAGILAAGIMVFLIVNPIFIAFPIAAMHREMKKARQSLLKGLHSQLDHLAGGGLTTGVVGSIDSAAFDSLLAVYHDAETLPTYPFSARAGFAFLVIYLAPFVLYLAAFVRFMT